MTPKKSGLRPRQSTWRKFQRWQVVLASVIAFFGTIIAALIPVWAPSSAPPSLAVGHSGSFPTPSLTPGIVTVAITSYSEVPSSPSPGETFSFYGIITGGWSLSDRGPQIFVIARQTGVTISPVSTRPWEVSPPAKALGGQKWSVTWKIAKPPINAHWYAIIASLPPEEAAAAASPSVAQYRADLTNNGIDSRYAAASSTAVHIP
jgi:hypothetical protein